MRVTNAMLANNMLNYMNVSQLRMDKLQHQIASGKKITVPSDDPVVASRALRFRSDVAEVEQFQRNNDDAKSWVETTEDALDKMTDIYHRLRELMVQGSSESISMNETKSIGQEIKQLKTQMIQVANTTNAGRYLFSGNYTDQKLILDDPDDVENYGKFNVTVKSTDRINYEIGVGNSININVYGGDLFNLGQDAIGEQVAFTTGKKVYFPLTLNETNHSFFIQTDGANPIEIAIDLDEVVQGEEGEEFQKTIQNMADLVGLVQGKLDEKNIDIMVKEDEEALQFVGADLPDGAKIEILNGSLDMGLLSLNETVERTTAKKGSLITYMDHLIGLFDEGKSIEIGNQLTVMDEEMDNLLRVRADLGARHNRLELTEKRLSMDKVSFMKLLSLNEDADMAEVIIELKNEENVYRSAMAAGARIIQPTLLDFLR